MRQIDIFRKVIRHMLNSTVFPKPYTHTPTHTGISQRRAPQIRNYMHILEAYLNPFAVSILKFPFLLVVHAKPSIDSS
jgi:hypothetical protein